MDIIMVFAENIMSVVIRVAGKAFNTKIVYEIKVFHLTRSDFVEARADKLVLDKIFFLEC